MDRRRSSLVKRNWHIVITNLSLLKAQDNMNQNLNIEILAFPYSRFCFRAITKRLTGPWEAVFNRFPFPRFTALGGRSSPAFGSLLPILVQDSYFFYVPSFVISFGFEYPRPILKWPCFARPIFELRDGQSSFLSSTILVG